MGEWLDLTKTHKFVQDNKLITAQYSKRLSVIGQKFIRIVIANIDPLKDDDFSTYKVKLAELADLLEIKDSKHIYRDIKKASTELLETHITISNAGKRASYRQYNLFSYCDYEDGDGTVTVRFNPDMKDFLLGLKKNFTQIPLEEIIFMSHKYSIRIYELIKMKLKRLPIYADKHEQIELTIEEIRKATNTEKKYKQIGQFKEFVIKPSIKDIEKNCNLHLETADIKEGRTIKGFQFDIWTRVGWSYKQSQKGQIEGQIHLSDIPDAGNYTTT